MSYTAEAADQVVRMSLEGGEVVIRLLGSGAKHLAIMLFAMARGEARQSGEARLMSMLKSGKELKVFALKDSDLEAFHREAKHYGILYTTLKNETVKDGTTDIMVRAEDVSRVNRMIERLQLSKADLGSVIAGIEEKEASKVISSREDPDGFAAALFEAPKEAENPYRDLAGADRQSSPSSKEQDGSPDQAFLRDGDRPSVRKLIEEIRKEQSAAEKETAERAVIKAIKERQER